MSTHDGVSSSSGLPRGRAQHGSAGLCWRTVAEDSPHWAGVAAALSTVLVQ